MCVCERERESENYLHFKIKATLWVWIEKIESLLSNSLWREKSWPNNAPGINRTYCACSQWDWVCLGPVHMHFLLSVRGGCVSLFVRAITFCALICTCFCSCERADCRSVGAAHLWSQADVDSHIISPSSGVHLRSPSRAGQAAGPDWAQVSLSISLCLNPFISILSGLLFFFLSMWKKFILNSPQTHSEFSQT